MFVKHVNVFNVKEVQSMFFGGVSENLLAKKSFWKIFVYILYYYFC